MTVGESPAMEFEKSGAYIPSEGASKKNGAPVSSPVAQVGIDDRIS